jgi:hypothetical protein
MKKVFEGKLKKLDKETQMALEKAKRQQELAEAKRDAAVAAGEEHWVECYDPVTGCFYYYGTIKNSTIWEKPEHYVMAVDDDLMVAVLKIQCLYRSKAAHREAEKRRLAMPKWYAYDDGEGHIYYFNSRTGVKTYIKPEDYDGEGLVSPVLMKQIMSGNMKRLDARTHKALRKAQEQQRQAVVDRDLAIQWGDDNWVEHFDEVEGKLYYIGKVTGKKTWEKPVNYVMEVDDDMLIAVAKIQIAFREQQLYRRKQLALVAERKREELAKRPQLMTNGWRRAQIFEGQETTKNMKKVFERDKEKIEAERRLALAKERWKKEEEKADLTWIEVYDPVHEAFYYFNRISEEVVWEKPEKYLMIADDKTMKAVIKIQCAFRAKIARHGISLRRKKQRVWIEALDKDSGYPYYYNIETRQCVWQKPAGFIAGAKADEEILHAMKIAYEATKSEKQKKFDEAKEKRSEEEANADWSWVEV